VVASTQNIRPSVMGRMENQIKFQRQR